MRRRAVLDASAAVHIVCGLTAASHLLDTLADTALVMAPDLNTSEVANALWKYVTHESMPRDEAGRLLADARNLVDVRIATDDLAEEALVASLTYGHPVYDMLYAVLARRHGAPVVTMDRRLVSVLEKMAIEFVLGSSSTCER